MAGYTALRRFFEHLPDLLTGPEARFSFFNGLGATSESFNHRLQDSVSFVLRCFILRCLHEPSGAASFRCGDQSDMERSGLGRGSDTRRHLGRYAKLLYIEALQAAYRTDVDLVENCTIFIVPLFSRSSDGFTDVCYSTTTGP